MKTLLNIDWDKRSVCIRELEDRATPRMIFSITTSGTTFIGQDIMFLLPDDKTATVQVIAADAKGFSAPVEDLTFSSSDETIVTVDAAGLITPVGIGMATVNVTADAQIGEGVTTIAGMLEVQVVAGQAVSLNVTAAIN